MAMAMAPTATVARNAGNPFIVAPCLAKDGKEKIEAWDKFQRFCFIIETKAYLEQRLPEAGKEPAEGAKAITDT